MSSLNKENPSCPASFGRTVARTLSVMIALAIMVLVVCYPRAIATDMTSVPHGWLVMLLIGMSICWVYGLGFTPYNRILKVIFTPFLGWPLVAIGTWAIFF